MDGRAQRKALTAAEQAIRALGRGDGDAARAAASNAEHLDQLGVYRGLKEAAAAVANEPDEAAWDALSALLGPGPFLQLIEGVR